IERHAAEAAPAALRARIGDGLLAALEARLGPACRSPEAERALDALARRLLGPGGRIVVLPGAAPVALALPGGVVAVSHVLVEEHEIPEVLAGHVLAARVAAEAEPPLRRLLAEAGLPAALALLTRGALPAGTLAAHARRLLAAPAPTPPDEALLAAFAAAGVSARPYAFARDVTGESTLALIEADPAPGGSTPPLLDDGAWVALQGICGG
ncbi:MAG: hypothetical protein D6832_00145, partial [Alphaproteobacteria bacterium]